MPFLSDIPVLGNLFKYEARAKKKKNLIILLTPRIIHDQAEMRLVSDDARRRFRNSVRGKSKPLDATLGRMVPNRLRAAPAKSSGVLLPAVDLGAEDQAD